MIDIEIEKLDPLLDRMRAYPVQSAQVMNKTMEASLLTLWENVPPYPEWVSSYVRTGTLGRSLGSSMGGGISGGKPDIYEVHTLGSNVEGQFGTRVQYAPQVIGEHEQQPPWSRPIGWWTISDIVTASVEKINTLWETAAEELAAWLDGK